MNVMVTWCPLPCLINLVNVMVTWCPLPWQTEQWTKSGVSGFTPSTTWTIPVCGIETTDLPGWWLVRHWDGPRHYDTTILINLTSVFLISSLVMKRSHGQLNTHIYFGNNDARIDCGNHYSLSHHLSQLVMPSPSLILDWFTLAYLMTLGVIWFLDNDIFAIYVDIDKDMAKADIRGVVQFRITSA